MPRPRTSSGWLLCSLIWPRINVETLSIQVVADEIGRHFVRQMPAPAHHPLLHGPGIRPDPQHLQIVIRFENQPRPFRADECAENR